MTTTPRTEVRRYHAEPTDADEHNTDAAVAGCLHLTDSDRDEVGVHEDSDVAGTLLVGVRLGAIPLPAMKARLDRVAVVALRDFLDEWLTATQVDAPAATIPDTLED